MRKKNPLRRGWESFLRFTAMHSGMIIVALLVVTAAVPFLTTNRYVLRIGTLCLVNIILTLGLNLVTGYMGQMSFGQAAFWGIGAYAGTLLIMKLGFSTIPAMLAATVISGLFGYLVALPSLKLKGYYLTIVTMGFCEIVRLVELNWTSLTGGALGIMNIPPVTIFGQTLRSPRAMYLMALVMVVIVTVIVKNLIDSSFGLSIKAIRDDEDAAETMGINIVSIKRRNFVISAMIAGFAGAFYAQYVTFIHPTIFTTAASQELVVMIIFGGLGSLPGTFLGAIALTLLPELLRDLLQYRMLIYGALMVIMMILKPDGLLGNLNLGLIRRVETERREAAGKGGSRV